MCKETCFFTHLTHYFFWKRCSFPKNLSFFSFLPFQICCPLPPLDHIFFPTDIKPGEGEDGEELDYSEVDPQFGPPGGDADNYDYGGGDVGDYDGIVDYDGFELSFGPLKPEERCKFVNGSECMDLHQCHADGN